MVISKKIKHSILAISMLLVFAFIALTGCGGNQTESLTKEEYAEAMNATYEVMVDAVTSDLSTFKMARAISDDDYIDLTSNNEGFMLARNLIKFTSAILTNEEYVLTDKIIAFVATPNEMAGQANFKMKLNFENNCIKVTYMMTVEQNQGFYQYMDATINYDFECKIIKSYEIDSVSKSDTQENMNRFDRYVYAPSTGTKILSSNTNSFEEIKNEKKTNAENFYKADFVQTNYDFSEEFPKT